jgi:hypothetical protein
MQTYEWMNFAWYLLLICWMLNLWWIEGVGGATHNIYGKKKLYALGALGALDVGHKKHKWKGGATCNRWKKTLFTLGVLGALDFGHMTQSGIKGGWGCEHWKIKAWNVMEHVHKPKPRSAKGNGAWA